MRPIFKVRNLTIRNLEEHERRLWSPDAEVIVSVEGDEYEYDAYLTSEEATQLAAALTPL